MSLRQVFSASVIFLAAIHVINPASANDASPAEYNWSFHVNSAAVAGHITTVMLDSCPLGVKADEPGYWAYLSGKGIAEVSLITGGTCKGDKKAGTLQFTPRQNHAAGYSIGSASDGLQEAILGTRFTPTNPTGTPQSGKIVLASGEYKLHAPVSLRSSYQTIDMSGAILECYMDETCLFVGDPTNSVSFTDITLIGPRGRPMVRNGTKPFIEVNAQATRLFDVGVRLPLSGATFGTLVQVDDDQAFLLDGMAGETGVRCDATFCGSYVTAPGPFNRWSAVGWLKNLNISPQCRGNGVLWQSGNSLRISDSVIQGYSQYGVRTGHDRGGYGNTVLDNVYMEAGNCTNPALNDAHASAGVIVNGGKLTINGGMGPQGVMPCFTKNCSGEPTDLRYYLVANKSGQGSSNAFYLGRADSAGSGTINVFWPAISSATSYDLLVLTARGNVTNAPYGTDDFAVATGIPASGCTVGICTLVDKQGTRSSYTIPTPNYYPKVDFWPGDVMLAGVDSRDLLSAGKLETDHGLSVINSELGIRGSVISAKYCGVVGGISTSSWATCLNPDLPPQTSYSQGATILAVKPSADGGSSTNLKGRFNFSTLGSPPGHIITLYDSNFAKTVADRFNRPINDPGDAYIGYDYRDAGTGTQYGISFGAPYSLSNYIGNSGDGKAWKERLTASLKEFRTNVRINGNLTVTGSCTGCATGDDNSGRQSESKPLQFSYTFFDPRSPITTEYQVPSVYVNRSALLRVIEVYCEIDAGEATINLETGGAKLLKDDLVCSQKGTSMRSSPSAGPLDVGQKINHVTVSAHGPIHRMNVVVVYVAD